MKKSRSLYLHEETNDGKIAALEALHVEYKRYLQTCVEHLIAQRRLNVPRGEKLRFFPKESILATNIVGACQEHAIGIVKGWAASRYTTKLRSKIHQDFKAGAIDELTKVQLHTIGKYLIDRPSDAFSRERIDQYWDLLLSSGKTPTISPRVMIQCGVNTADFRRIETAKLTEWWVSFSTLTRYQTVRLPLKGNPFVKKAEDLVKGLQFKKDRRGRWRMDAVERKLAEAPPRLPPTAPRIGVDVGLNVIAATSDGWLYGQEAKPKFDKLYGKVRELRANRQRQGRRENSCDQSARTFRGQ